MQGIDVIGDIHGYATELSLLLHHLEHRDLDGTINMDNQRKIVFIGDYVDRGSEQKMTIDIVRSLVECDKAHALMGNHELGAIQYGLRLPDGPKREKRYGNKHSPANAKGHGAFLREFPIESAEYEEVHANFFQKLPIYLEIDGAQFIHACWDEGSLAQVRPYLDDAHCLTYAAHVGIAQKEEPLYSGIRHLLYGPKHNP